MLSFATLATPGFSVEEAIRMARKFGYEGIDLRVSENKGELTEKSTQAEIKYIREVMAAEGIRPAGLFCYNKSGNLEIQSWNEMKESILRLIDIAMNLGSPSIRISAGNPGIFQDRRQYIQKNAEVISSLLSSMNFHVDLLIQNHIGAYTAVEAVELIKLVASERFGLAFSPDHCLLDRKNTEEVYRLVKGVTKQVYIADIIKDNEKYTEVFPGEGDLPIKEILPALGENGFPGWITFKWEKLWHDELAGPEVALPRFVDYMKALLKS